MLQQGSINEKFSILKCRPRAERYKQVSWSSVNKSCNCHFALYSSGTLQRDLELPSSSPNAFGFSLHNNKACLPVVFLPPLPMKTSMRLGCLVVLQVELFRNKPVKDQFLQHNSLISSSTPWDEYRNIHIPRAPSSVTQLWSKICSNKCFPRYPFFWLILTATALLSQNEPYK